MRKFVINLDEDTERLQRFTRSNAHIRGIERFPAVLGLKLDRKKLEAQGYLAGPIKYGNGTLGLAMSHISLWEKTARDNAPSLVSEDDALFARNFDDMAAKLEQIDPAWEFIAWGFNFNAYVWLEVPDGVGRSRIEFNEADLRKNIERWSSNHIHSTLLRLKHYFGLCGYSVSPAGAKKLLEGCLPIRDQVVNFAPYDDVVIANKSFDSWVNRTLPKLNAYVSMPPLIVTPRDEAKSSISRVNSERAAAAQKRPV